MLSVKVWSCIDKNRVIDSITCNDDCACVKIDS